MTSVPLQAVYGTLVAIADLVAAAGIERDRVYRVDENSVSMREAFDIVRFNANLKARSDGTIQVDDSVVDVVRQLTQCVTKLQEAALTGGDTFL